MNNWNDKQWWFNYFERLSYFSTNYLRHRKQVIPFGDQGLGIRGQGSGKYNFFNNLAFP